MAHFEDPQDVLPHHVVGARGSWLTATFWLNTLGDELTNGTVISAGFHDGVASTLDNEYAVIPSSNQLRLLINNREVSWRYPSINDGRSHHFAIASDAGTDQAELFLDGISLGIKSVPISPLQVSEDKLILGNKLFIDAGGFLNQQGSTHRFRGFLGEMTFWNTRLTAGQVRGVLEGDFSGTTGLQGHYEFLPADFPNVVDSSPAVNHGRQVFGSAVPLAILPDAKQPIRFPSQAGVDLNRDGIDDLVIVGDTASGKRVAARSSSLMGRRVALNCQPCSTHWRTCRYQAAARS